MSVNVRQWTQRHISEEFSLEHHHSEVFRSRTLHEFVKTAAVFCLQLQWDILLRISLYRRSHVTHGIRKQSDALGAFVKLQKATISFVMFVCLSVRPSVSPHGITRLQLDGFSWNFHESFMKFFENLYEKFEFHDNLTRTKSTLREYLCTFMLIKKAVPLQAWTGPEGS